MGTRLRRLRKVALWVAGCIVAILLANGLLNKLMWRWVAKPPPLPQDTSIMRETPRKEGGRVILGRNWLETREGLPVLYLTGTPFEIGYANGFLTQEYIHRQEDTMLLLLYRAVPRAWTRSVLKIFVVYRNRHLGEFVRPEHREELLGVSLGCTDTNPEMGPLYNRTLSYHAAQDISYMFQNSPLVSRGCTAFCAWGPATAGGHLLAGRNFDWEAAPVFDKDRIVVLCEPDHGIPFVSLSWGGMVGCVSGMNREGLFVSVNGAPSDLPKGIGTPTCLIVRQVLQNARTIADAEKIIGEATVFVSALFLVGSRADGRSVVVEKTPGHTAVRDAGEDPWVVCANHFMTPTLAPNPVNTAFLASDTSQPRYDRLAELLTAASGRLDPAAAAGILRDRNLAGGKFAGNGHRGSLNPLIATHSVIADLTDRLFWAASPPHQLGHFVAFDVTDFSAMRPDSAIPADPLLASGEYQRYCWASDLLTRGRTALRAGAPAEAAARARQAEELNPGFYANQLLLGEALLRSGDRASGCVALEEAARRQPATAGERGRADELLRSGRE